MTWETRFKNILRDFGLEYFSKYYGLYQAQVADNEDPDFMGRLKLIVPSITGKNVLDKWAWGKGQFAAANAGMFIIPNKGDVVWVAFENGDARYPVWEHGWWGKNDVPAAARNNGNKPTNQVWQSYSGHRIELDDKDGAEQVVITSKFGDKYVMDKTGISNVSKKISNGSLDGSAEPAALGQTLLNKLNTLCDKVEELATQTAAITVNTAVGISTVPTNITAITQIATDVTTLKATLDEILSSVNTLD